MKNTRKFFFTLIGLLAVGIIVFGDISSLKAQTSTFSMRGFAWAGISQTNGQPGGPGWISFGDDTNEPANYEVVVDASGNLNGYAWANPIDPVSGTRNFGWVKFGGLSGFPTGAGTTATNARLVGNNILGWARFCSATQSSMGTNFPGNCSTQTENINGGWDGWISFQGDAMSGGAEVGNYGVSVGLPNVDGDRFLSGFAWGGPINVGWIDMSRVFLKDNSTAGDKSKVSFTVAGVTASMTAPAVSTVVSSGGAIGISWEVNSVTNCQAGGDWLTTGVIARNSTDGTHIWPTPPSFVNSTTSPIEKNFRLTCQGDEFGTGMVGSMIRDVKVVILPGGNVASVVVTANPDVVPDSNGQFLTKLTWFAQNVVPSSCQGIAFFNGTQISIPKWSSSIPAPGTPGVFNGTSGFVTDVIVAGSNNMDNTKYVLACQRASGGAIGAMCYGMSNSVCGEDTVTIGEAKSLELTAHPNTNPNSAPINSVANAGDQITLKWRSPLSKDLDCSVLGNGAWSTPSTNWFGPKTDLSTVNSYVAFENDINVQAPTTYFLSCVDKNTLQVYNASTTVSVAGMNTLGLSLVARDQVDNDKNVVMGGTVKVDIKKLAGDFIPGSCFAMTENATGSDTYNTTWNSGPWNNWLNGPRDPDAVFSNITTTGSVGTQLFYRLTCADLLTGLPVTAEDYVTIIVEPTSNLHLEIQAVNNCVAPGQSVTLRIKSDSTPANPFTSCTVGYAPGSTASILTWTSSDFNNLFLNGPLGNLNGPGEVDFGPDGHNGSNGNIILPRITCVDSSGDSVSDQTFINVSDSCIAPPDPGGGSGNIKPIIDEQ